MGEASCPPSNQQCVESMQTIDRHNETANKQFDRGDSFSPLSHFTFRESKSQEGLTLALSLPKQGEDATNDE